MSEIDSLMNRVAKSTLLRFSTAGSVDDGKSTFIGRLLHDSKNIYEDHLRSLEKAASKLGESTHASLALVTDGLKAEQEQGITIDVAYRYFSTPTRHFILADTPGHEQYTRNMATGASTANLTIILIDARNGVVTQTKRHAFIASLLGVPRFLVAVNKMDLVDFSEEVFDRIRADFTEFSSRLDIKDIRFVPVSALEGDNVVEPSARMPWYEGETVMRYLENVYIGGDTNLVDFRYPVQHVIRPNQNYRGYAGQIASGTIRIGEEITVLPSGRKSKVKSIDAWTSSGPSSLEYAHAPMSVAITLDHEIDIGRGDMIVRSSNVPAAQTQFEAMVVWMDERPLDPSKAYIIHHTTREARVHVESVRYRIDVNTLSRLPGEPLSLNEIGRLGFTATSPLLLDPYQKNRSTGNFVLVDPDTFQTAAAGMVIDRLPHDALSAESFESLAEPTSTSHHLHLEKGLITPAEREQKLGNKGVTVWCTGLSGSGKSSIAQALERELFEVDRPVFRLDGDNLRFGLCSDLGFSDEDRAENIRRAAEVARLFNQAGLTVICSFISPFEKDRERARQIIGKERFIEVYMSTPLEECERRDPHGLYRKARAGEIRGFTGIDAPYEAPRHPDIELDTSRYPLEECVRTILARLIAKTHG